MCPSAAFEVLLVRRENFSSECREGSRNVLQDLGAVFLISSSK